MPVTTIKLVALGHLPPGFDPQSLLDWHSSVFTCSSQFESYQLSEDAKGDDWQFTDAQLEKYLASPFNEDFLVILVNVRLQYNWYVRRLSGNRIVFSFHEIADILRYHDLPLRNVVLRVLYAGTLVYRRHKNRIPSSDEPTNYTHDETRGCLFDMNASKWEVVHSCHEPVVCDPCVASLKLATVSNELVSTVQREIKKIKKPLFHRGADFVKRHPVWSLVLSIGTAFLVGLASSILGSFVFWLLTRAT